MNLYDNPLPISAKKKLIFLINDKKKLRAWGTYAQFFIVSKKQYFPMKTKQRKTFG